MRRCAGAGAEAPDGAGHSPPEWPARLEVEGRDALGLSRVCPAVKAPPRRPNGRRRKRSELGTGVVGTVVGFLIIMTLLLFCAQILVRLYATSTLTAVAARAAEDVAESPDPVTEMPLAVTQARQQLGPFGATRTRFQWVEVDGKQVVLEVRGNSPSLLPMPGGWNAITRTVTIRTERFR